MTNDIKKNNNRNLANNGKVEKPITETYRSHRTGAMRYVLTRDKVARG